VKFNALNGLSFLPPKLKRLFLKNLIDLGGITVKNALYSRFLSMKRTQRLSFLFSLPLPFKF
jgi:hypothetical protein